MTSLCTGLGLPPFRARFPWWGGDLQTLRDTARPPRLPEERAESLEIAIGGDDRLLALLDRPGPRVPVGVVLVLHGLGGDGDGVGPHRLALALQQEGFAVLRLNLRGAGPGRRLARGSYAARCSRDLAPALRRARAWAEQLGAETDGRPLPLFGAGLSLGGTILLNACLDAEQPRQGKGAALDGLVCISSPLDLAACALQFERPRNALYQRWLVARLCRQILADPFGLAEAEQRALLGAERPRTLRAFDAAITAPRWGHASVAAYYADASPGPRLVAGAPLPPTLLLHARDDPWVPAGATLALAATTPERRPAHLEVVVVSQGGHNGFHAVGDREIGSWGDRLTARWLRRRACG